MAYTVIAPDIEIEKSDLDAPHACYSWIYCFFPVSQMHMFICVSRDLFIRRP